jgi:hypothetical protein
MVNRQSESYGHLHSFLKVTYVVMMFCEITVEPAELCRHRRSLWALLGKCFLDENVSLVSFRYRAIQINGFLHVSLLTQKIE